ncbi:MAG: CHY zinc finger protein [Candidatus Binataceae bacterium]
MEISIAGIPVRGIGLDAHTRCEHYRGVTDIVAIKFKCCVTYYSCYYCHQAQSGHGVQIWPRSEFEEKAILCGACGTELTIRQYLECGAICPGCAAGFNPRCELHYSLYFEMTS